MTSLFRNCLARSFRAFRRAEHGNVAIMFAIAIVPIIGLVGAAVDYSRANAARSALQSALDATALMISREAAGLSEEEITRRAQAYFESLYNHSDASIAPLNVHYTPNSGNGASVSISTSGSIQTAFMKVAGFPTIGFGSSTSTKWGASRMRVAMALDITLSMTMGGGSPSKLQAMKTAAKGLVDTLKASATNSQDVYVSIVPFNVMVKVGTDNVGADWLDWSLWEAEPAVLDPNATIDSKGTRGAKPSGWSNVGPGSNCPFTSSSHGFTCTDRAATASGARSTSKIPSSGLICPSIDDGRNGAVNDAMGRRLSSGILYYNGCYDSVPSTTTTTTTVSSGRNASCGNRDNCTCTGSGSGRVCKQTTTSVGAPYTHNWVVNDRSTWTGCVTDRNQDADTTAVAPSSTATKYPAMQYKDCSASPILPLTSAFDATESDTSTDNSTLKGRINNLVASGSTNQSIGMHWAWMSLKQTDPLNAPAFEENYGYDNIIILLSDGENTLNRWYGTTGGVWASGVDDRQKLLCDNAKADGIEIYTIQVGTMTSDVLQYCATSPSHAFTTTTAAGIGSAFNQIASQLSRLRLTQ